MQRALFIAALCVSLLSCNGSTGNIVGHIHVAAGHPDKGVFVILWQIPSALQDPSDPSSPLVPAVARSQVMQNATVLGQIAVGVTDNEARDFYYNLYSIERGLYVVGAYLDANQDPNRNFLADLNYIGSDEPIEVDPAMVNRKTVTRDIYLGQSAPDKGTLSGVLHMSERTAAASTMLIAFDGNPFTEGDASVIAQRQVSGAADVPFDLYNVPLSGDGAARKLYLTAITDGNGDGDLSFYSDFVSILRENPVYLTPESREATGLELWMDRQAPDRASLSGEATLSGPLQFVSDTLLVFSSDPMTNANANVVAVFNGQYEGTASLPFSIPSLPKGAVWMIGLLQTPGVFDNDVSAQYNYGASELGMKPIQLSADSPHVTNFEFPMGVGRVSGVIDLNGAPETTAFAEVYATRSGSTELVRYDVITFEQGQRLVPYELFGLDDGAYDVSLETNDGIILRGSPKTVVLASPALREGSDFHFPAE